MTATVSQSSRSYSAHRETHLTAIQFSQTILPVPAPTKGLSKLREFIVAKDLRVAELYRGLVSRFGEAVKYSRVLSWVRGSRVPTEEGRRWLFAACGIDPNDWLTPEQLAKKVWQEQGHAAGAN